MRHIGMEEVGWWGDPREGFILTKPYMARRHVRQTDAPGSTGATFLQPFSAQTLTLISSCSGAAMLRTLGVAWLQLLSDWKWTRLIPWSDDMT